MAGRFIAAEICLNFSYSTYLFSSTQALATLSPIPPPLHLHPSTIPRCDSLTSFLIQPSARILVACAHSRFTIPPHYLCASSLLAPIHLPK